MVFYQVGKLINTLRWPIIIVWLLLIAACIPFLPKIMDPFKTTGFMDEHSESYKATQYLNQKFGYDNNNQFVLLYHSEKLRANSDEFLNKVKKSLADLKDFPIDHEILLPNKKQQISKDKHSAYAVVVVKTPKQLTDAQLSLFKSLIKKPVDMTLKIGGEPLFVEQVTHQTQVDLYRADMIATPVALITLLFVFGSAVAAILPLVLGSGCALIILTTLYFIGHYYTLSVFTINIALLLGLCLCLDYSLFFINRFRDELLNGLKINEAIAVTQNSAGKAIFFSGLAVFISLSALFLFPINILFSVAVGGLAAVFYAVLFSTVLLPAILAVIKNKINRFTVHIIPKKARSNFSIWHWIAERVVHRPYTVFLTILCLLLVLGYPFLSAQFGISDYRIFPEKSPARSFYDKYAQAFDIEELTPIQLIIESPQTSILSKVNLNKIYDLVEKLEKNPRIKKVTGIVSSNSDLKKNQYYPLYHNKQSLKNTDIKQLLATSTLTHLTVLNIVSKYSLNSAETKKLIKELRQMKPPTGMNFYLTGTAVSSVDVLATIYRVLPHAMIWIMVFSYLILLILLRSVFLPFKAILMNLLSLCASYGALVFVFQEGHFAQWLNFQPQEMLDISLLVIIFCALFGFSMDYEVFLLTRIREAYLLTRDNNKSIVFGIEKSSRIITSAALIVIVLCASFLVADVLMVKAFGLGIAVAIFMDAFLIRSFLVPATMALFKSWNWYLPRWLDRILPNL
ncbi:MAG: hypothetical protein BGO90_09500 [Legionella sp. 40-6]|nr:MMPL family transporter [Legionella sp.]OJY43826.1 MAG: hypothetical protein BGO90_09500 [Legionella sp. 40-6]